MDSEAPPPGPSPPPSAAPIPTFQGNTHRTIARSCHSCNRKKIRCDKNDPCSACTRAGRPCVFPRQGPRIRRTKKTIIADMSTRLADLEKNLTRAKDRPKSPSVVEASRSLSDGPQTKSTSYASPLTDNSREDVLVQRGSSSHYFNEVFLSRVIREVSQYEPLGIVDASMILTRHKGTNSGISFDSSNFNTTTSGRVSIQRCRNPFLSGFVCDTCQPSSPKVSGHKAMAHFRGQRRKLRWPKAIACSIRRAKSVFGHRQCICGALGRSCSKLCNLLRRYHHS